MAYDELLVNRLREALSEQPVVEEVSMFQGICFMVNDKMCICVRDQGMLCRIGQQQAAIELEKNNCRQMVHGSRIMKDFVHVDMDDVKTNQEFNHWINLALQFNKIAKASKKRKKD